MSITWQQLKPARHTWFMSEAQNRRLQKSLSDLNGRNANIQGGTVEGVMRELCNAFIRRGPQPGVPQMLRTYLRVRAKVDEVMQVADAASMFEAKFLRIFALLLGPSLKKRNGLCALCGPGLKYQLIFELRYAPACDADLP